MGLDREASLVLSDQSATDLPGQSLDHSTSRKDFSISKLVEMPNEDFSLHVCESLTAFGVDSRS